VTKFIFRSAALVSLMAAMATLGTGCYVAGSGPAYAEEGEDQAPPQGEPMAQAPQC
jgi:hypothetical protein